MNIMRKLWVSGSGQPEPPSSPSISLGTMHLRKLFSDYTHSPSDDKLYNMLPLFSKVFVSCSPGEMSDKFPELPSFSSALSRLLVAEVRKRASSENTEIAALSIVSFFESGVSEEESPGWLLLSTLNLIGAGDEVLVGTLAGAAVPSTLVKCLYLFFDLPEIEPPETKGPTSDFSPMERRLVLQKVFVQLLIRLSSHPSPVEELVERDDLALLFSAVTSFCPPHNGMWRKSASEVLMTISTQIGHSPPLLSYIHAKKCIGLCVSNLRSGSSKLTPLEITEMVLTIFCFLKDSSDYSQDLLDGFKSAGGYQFFIEILLRFETDVSSESQEGIRNLVLVISSLTMCGYSPLKPNMANVESLFSLPSFQLPSPGLKGCTVRNLSSFQTLHTLFNRSSTSFLSTCVLDALFTIFRADPSNYFISDSILPQMAEKLPSKSPEVLGKYLEIVKYLVTDLQFTPCKELISISRLVKSEEGERSSSSEERDIGVKMQCVKMLLLVSKFHPMFKDVYREIGILEALTTCLHRFASDIRLDEDDGLSESREELGLLVVELLTIILTGATSNVSIFRENGGSRAGLQIIINSSRMRGPALGLYQQLLMSQGGDEDMTALLVSLSSSSILLRTQLLSALLSTFRESHRARCNFRKAGGFLYLMSLLVSLEDSLLSSQGEIRLETERLQLVQLIFTSLALAMRFEPASAKLFQEEICLPSFAHTLRLLGPFSKTHNKYLGESFFDNKNEKYYQNSSKNWQKDEKNSISSQNNENLTSTIDNATPSQNTTKNSFVSKNSPEDLLPIYHSLFITCLNYDESDVGKNSKNIPLSLHVTIFLFRLLYNLAIDSFEKNLPLPVTLPPSRSSPKKNYEKNLNFSPPSPEPVIIHSAVVIVMVQLLPYISGQNCEKNDEKMTDLRQKEGVNDEKTTDKKLMNEGENLGLGEDAVDSCGSVKKYNLENLANEKDGKNNSLEDDDEKFNLVVEGCMLYCAELIKSLVRTERNQQVMAEAGLVEVLLEVCSGALSDEGNFLHLPIHYIFERTATQRLTPKDLRQFLRLGNPLNCLRSSSPPTSLSPLPLSRLKSLVSMSLCRSTHSPPPSSPLIGSSSSKNPPIGSSSSSKTPPIGGTSGGEGRVSSTPFAEFDMSAEGFGALFLPSLSVSGGGSGESGSSLLPAGIGMGDRVFPGVSGMSFSTWFSVDKFSDPRTDPHPIRLLTIIKETNGTSRLSLCLLVSARDKAMIVSTRESNLPPQGVGEWEPDGVSGGSVRVWCPELLHESQWHHLFFSFSPSSFSLFVNGRAAHSGKLDYPQRSRGASYSGFIGTPPAWRRASRLTWRQGVAHFFEDWTVGAPTVLNIYKLGPEYVGSWQAVRIGTEPPITLVAEDKIIFGLNATAVSQLTLAKIRKIYSKADAKAIAKQLGLSSHENATPISILHNSAAHLMGPARTLGGVSIGYLGVRIFSPLPLPRGILAVGGVGVLLGLVAMANSGEALYAALKALVSVLKSNGTGGGLVPESSWQTLSFLLKRKKNLLSMRVLHLVFSLVSSDMSTFGKENRTGFIELLGDIEIWCPLSASSAKSTSPSPSQKFEFLEANVDLEKALYEHFLQLLSEDSKTTLELLRESSLVSKLLRRLRMSTCNQSSIFLLLSHLLAHKGNGNSGDLVSFGHFIAGLLPADLLKEREGEINEGIELRNRSLQLLHSLMYTGKVLNVGFCEELVSRLGFDFILLFLSPSLHPSTTLWSLRTLLLLLTSSTFSSSKFTNFSSSSSISSSSSSSSSSGWGFSRTVLQSSASSSSLLQLRRGESQDESGSGTPTGAGGGIGGGGGRGKSGVGGWERVSWLLAERIEGSKDAESFPSEIWLILCAMVLSQPCRNVSLRLSETQEISLDSVWNYVFGVPSTRMSSSLYGKVVLCPDAIMTLLTLIRCYIYYKNETGIPNSAHHLGTKNDKNIKRDIPTVLLEFLSYLYTNTPEFQPTLTSTEVLSALAASLMPIDVHSLSSPPFSLKMFKKDEFSGSELDKEGDEIFEKEEIELGQEAEVDLSSHSSCNYLNHPAQKYLLDFLRVVIMDAMTSAGSKNTNNISGIIDTVLEGGREESENSFPLALMREYHTKLLGSVLDHLMSTEIESLTTYLQAVGLFLCRVVDKLWLDSFKRDPLVLFDFILLLIGHCKTKRVAPGTTDMIYNSLNRVVLYILSRKSHAWAKVEALKKIRSVRTLIFGSGNHQSEFFGCLVFILMELIEGFTISLEGTVKSQWHVSANTTYGESCARDGNGRELESEISGTAEKVWDDLFISKKPLVEDVFKITFPSPQPPPLSSLREEIGESGRKLWARYVAAETCPLAKKSGGSSGAAQSWEIHQQLQSKLQRVTGGLTRLAGRSGIRKESEKEKNVKNILSQWGDARRCHVSSNKQVNMLREGLEAQERTFIENRKHLHRYVRDILLPQLETELTRERGLWGPSQPSHLDKWMLDTTEGPCRMRKKLMRNEMFYVHYPYLEQNNPSIKGSSSSATSSPKGRRMNPPISRDSREFSKKFKHQPSLISELVSGGSCSSVDEVEIESYVISNAKEEGNLASPKGGGDESFSEAQMADTASDPDNQSMLFRLIGTANEKISQIFRVAQIHGLDTAEGLLLFGKEHFYLISGFTILAKTREIKDMYYLPPSCYEPILPPQCYGSGPTPAKPRSKAHTCWKFSYEDLKEVHKRRYLLQPIALEIFCSDGINYLLAFPRKVRNVVFNKFTSVRKGLSDSGQDGKQSVAGQRRSTSVEQSGGLFSSIIGETSVTQRWVRGEMSNFQYLMHLNTLAGRSYNDLMQYPVFPWILSDYDSPLLDLSDPHSFRDLSRPMGAQSNSRLTQFVKRFKEWDDPHGETPPYHYGTHYSSAMIVCSYLVRMEPFAQHFLRLQGGHFDLADRMFHSIKEAWNSASRHNMADVKELIPEFFYLPEFLQNQNNFDLGFKQNGVALGEVLLPPWAKDDPREFIRVHREALESDYVSQHLHEWIDLIFGYKQQGQAAVEAVNVFHHLFYEGNVDIYTIDDPLKKNATIGFINNFGQIPKQLFKKPHPAKKVSSSAPSLSLIKSYSLLEGPNQLFALAANAGSQISGSSQLTSGCGDKLFYHYLSFLRPTLSPLKELRGPTGQILPLDTTSRSPPHFLAVEQNKALLSSSRYVGWGFADGSLRTSTMETDRAVLIVEGGGNNAGCGSGEVVVCTAASEKILITGSSNSVVSVWELSEPPCRDLKLLAHLFAHSEPITALVASLPYNILVSGSKDASVIIWDLARLCFLRQLGRHGGPIAALAVNDLTGEIGTADGSWVRVWSINGELLGQVDTGGVGGGGGMSQGVLCLAFTTLNEWDADNLLLTGSTDGIVRMWSLRYVQVPDEDFSQPFSPPHSPLHSSSSSSSPSFSITSLHEKIVAQNSSDDHVFLANIQDTQLEKQENTQIYQENLQNPDNNSQNIENSDRNESKVEKRVRMRGELDVVSREDKKLKRRSDGGSESKNNEEIRTKNNSGRVRSSKSESSMSYEEEESSFEVVSEAEVGSLKPDEAELRRVSVGTALLEYHTLQENHIWQRRLVFRGKLTMHTAYDRQDNKEPASITALAVSKDHKNVYVGDARGRVFSWSVSDSASGRVDHWVRDEVSDNCGTCKIKFSLTERKHHCRSCGAVFCGKCSRFESEIYRLRILNKVRVCQPCFTQLKKSNK